MHHGTREVDGARVALCGKPANHRATGIPQTQCLGNLVEGLAHGVIDGGAQNLVVAPPAHVDQHGVTTRDQTRHKGRLEVRRLEEVGEKVPLKMVHRNEWQTR